MIAITINTKQLQQHKKTKTLFYCGKVKLTASWYSKQSLALTALLQMTTRQRLLCEFPIHATRMTPRTIENIDPMVRDHLDSLTDIGKGKKGLVGSLWTRLVLAAGNMKGLEQKKATLLKLQLGGEDSRLLRDEIAYSRVEAVEVIIECTRALIQKSLDDSIRALNKAYYAQGDLRYQASQIHGTRYSAESRLFDLKVEAAFAGYTEETKAESVALCRTILALEAAERDLVEPIGVATARVAAAEQRVEELRDELGATRGFYADYVANCSA